MVSLLVLLTVDVVMQYCKTSIEVDEKHTKRYFPYKI